MGLDLRAEYTITNDQGLLEDPQSKLPSSLQLCAEFDLTCHFALTRMIRAQAKQEIKELVSRIVERAEEYKMYMEWRIHRTIHELDSESDKSSSSASISS